MKRPKQWTREQLEGARLTWERKARAALDDWNRRKQQAALPLVPEREQ